MAKYIIHVGPHKTGSTYIQNGLLINRQTLLEKGISYPDSFITDAVSWCHFDLFRLLREGKHEEIAVKFEALDRSRAAVIVLSSEDLSTLNERELNGLREVTGSNVEIVFYLRRWSELLPSGAQEEIRHGGMRTLPEFCFGHVSRPYASDIVNFRIKLDRFAGVFGDDSMRVISFNNVLDEKSDLFMHFVEQILEIDPKTLILPTQKHQSVPIQHIELLRALNVIRKMQPNSPTHWPTSRFLADFSKQEFTDILEVIEKHEAFLHLNEFDRPLSFIYTETVERFGPVMLPPYSNNIIFKRQNRKIPYITPNYLVVPGIIDRLTEAYHVMIGPDR